MYVVYSQMAPGKCGDLRSLAAVHSLNWIANAVVRLARQWVNIKVRLWDVSMTLGSCYSLSVGITQARLGGEWSNLFHFSSWNHACRLRQDSVPANSQSG